MVVLSTSSIGVAPTTWGTTGGGMMAPCMARAYTWRESMGVVGNCEGHSRLLSAVLDIIIAVPNVMYSAAL